MKVTLSCLDNVGANQCELRAVDLCCTVCEHLHKLLGQTQSLSERLSLFAHLHLVVVSVALALVALGDVAAERARVRVDLAAVLALEALAFLFAALHDCWLCTLFRSNISCGSLCLRSKFSHGFIIRISDF